MSAREGLWKALEGKSDLGGPEWLSGLRRAAEESLDRSGFPTKKLEAWRFTSVREIVETPFEAAPRGDDRAREIADRFSDDALRIVLADGAPIGGDLKSDGVHARSLKAVLDREPALLEPVLGKVARSEYFGALNSALFQDGIVLSIAKSARPIHLVHVARKSDRPTACYPRIVVVCEGEATLIESYVAEDGGAKHLTNSVTEVVVSEGASLDHTRIVYGSDRTMHIAQLAIRQHARSRYTSRVAALGGALTRLEIDAHLVGEGAQLRLDGIYCVDRKEHVDHQIAVDHAAVEGKSWTRYRGILDGAGHAVWNAMGLVRRDAQRCEAHQENRNLLLSDDATIDTKPHLEIEADDVRATHGATIGAVDDDALFYLRARGIPENEARAVLTFAFVREIAGAIPHQASARRVQEALLARLGAGDPQEIL